jgi:anti-sigma B factor antagonist
VAAGHEVSVERDGDKVRLVLTGEIDLSAAPDVAVHAEQALVGNPATVVVDLSGATFLDSSGIGALVVLTNSAESRPTTLHLKPGPPNVMRVLDLVGLTDTFQLVD